MLFLKNTFTLMITAMVPVTPLTAKVGYISKFHTMQKPGIGRIITIVCIALLLIGCGYIIGQITTPKSSVADTLTAAPIILEQKAINKTFSFPVDNPQGIQVATISYTITSVDKQNQIIVKGQRAEAVQGRTFFIINLTLTNPSTQIVQLNTRDYIRISVGNSSDLLAADIHNDPLIIQPTSTEYTKLGFPIDSKETHIILHVGQLSGSKTDIPITLK